MSSSLIVSASSVFLKSQPKNGISEKKGTLFSFSVVLYFIVAGGFIFSGLFVVGFSLRSQEHAKIPAANIASILMNCFMWLKIL